MTIWGFVWSLWKWLCGPEVDLTGGCMFSLVWTRLLFRLQRIKTAEWVFLFLHHLCPNVSQQQLMLQWWFCQQKSPAEYIIPIITVFFFPLTKGWNCNISMTHRFEFFFVWLYLLIKSIFFACRLDFKWQLSSFVDCKWIFVQHVYFYYVVLPSTEIWTCGQRDHLAEWFSGWKHKAEVQIILVL